MEYFEICFTLKTLLKQKKKEIKTKTAREREIISQKSCARFLFQIHCILFKSRKNTLV